MFAEKHSNGALIGAMREATWSMRTIASVVIITFGGLVTLPAEAAIQQEVKQLQQQTAAEGPGSRFSGEMKSIKEHLAAALKTPKGTSLMDVRRQLNVDATLIAASDKEMQDGFSATRTMIKDKHLPDVIMQRELAAEKHYNTEMAALKQGLAGIAAENDDAKAQARSKDVLDRLSQFQDERKAQKFDPKNLPNRSLKPDLTRKPHLTKKAFAEAGFVSNPRLMVATTAPNFDYSQLPGANDPAYLAATTEVTLSPAIQAKAAALNYNPVQIYNWVRNNVQWQPTWGAVQDADLTLSAQRGNAFDISSLLIALLRASNIPARYVHGTINVPEAKFRNWVGGFQDINAAVNYASAGGIPITSLVSGGKITTIQMEHIWVEAAIDYIPSRGAVNKSADTWVPMDASYKQYNYKQGLDVIKIANLDVNSLAQQFSASGSVDGTDSWASGQNPSMFQSAQIAAQQALSNYLQSNLPNATTEDIVGGADIVGVQSGYIPATTPNQIVVVGSRYGALPSILEQSITFGLGLDDTGEPENATRIPWATVNNKLITLSFDPASQADTNALDALVVIDPSTDQAIFPNTIPAYLINVVPTLRVNDVVVTTGSAMTMGSDLTFSFTPTFAGRDDVPYTYSLSAGSYVAVAAIAGNISPAILSATQNQIQQTMNLINGASPGNIALDKQTTIGSVFQSALLGYYLQYIEGAKFLGNRQGGSLYLAAGLGSFGLEPTVNYAFGVPTALTGAQVVMNLPMINVFGFDGTPQAKLNYVLETGAVSSILEYAVPNQLFSGIGQSLGGASAETALAAASAQGQHIYHITQGNESTILPLLNQPSNEMSDIQNGLSVGKEVVASSSTVTVPGLTGAGYIIYDPISGDGAYKISGSQNGFKGEFDPNLAFHYNVWTILVWGFDFIKYLKITGMLVDAISFINDLTVIEEHCSGSMLLEYTTLYSMLTIAFLALALLGGPLVIALSTLLAPWIAGFAMDMITARCDAHPNG